MVDLPLQVFEHRSGTPVNFATDPAQHSQRAVSANQPPPSNLHDGAQQSSAHRARQSVHSGGSTEGQAVQRAGHLNRKQHKRQAPSIAQDRYLEHQAGYGPVRSCHSHAHSRSPYGKNWWVPPPQQAQQQRQRQRQRQQQQLLAPAPSPNMHQASGMLQHCADQQGDGEFSRQTQDQRSPQQRNATLRPRLPVGQPPLPAVAPVQAPLPTAAAPLHPLGQQLEPHAHGMAAQGRYMMDLWQPHGNMQPVQSSSVHAKQASAIRQRPAPAIHHVPGMPASALSQLHNEIEIFAQRATSTKVETEAVKELERIVSEAALEIWPHCRVGLFGSQSCAMALPGSDVDITILDVSGPPKKGAAGFTLKQRKAVVQELRRLLKALTKLKLVCGKAQVISARVPIVKCLLMVNGVQMAADISMGVNNGIDAVPYIMQQVQFFGPSLRALTIIIKALLKQASLNERVSGGLGSYCILNVVMAHLMSEGVRATSPVNLGHLLLSLLQFFGRTMDCGRHAISVSRGGIVDKQQQWQQEDKPFLLAVEDPQHPGTDIGSGSYNIQEVRGCMARAHDVLHASCCSMAADAAKPSWAAVQAEGQDFCVAAPSSSDFPLLNCILNTSLALDRSPSASQARMNMSMTSQPLHKVKPKPPKGTRVKKRFQFAHERRAAKGQPTANEPAAPKRLRGAPQAKKKWQGKGSSKRKAPVANEHGDTSRRKRARVHKSRASDR
ncbi:probable terminal nucleotidyltransferase 4B [Coccomyxa sp. Obi]|nr:probable terminal nucleotidyltransferase 4B [Coccomyxa sp. Obi]